jgi:hypothetical protein
VRLAAKTFNTYVDQLQEIGQMLVAVLPDSQSCLLIKPGGGAVDAMDARWFPPLMGRHEGVATLRCEKYIAVSAVGP